MDDSFRQTDSLSARQLMMLQSLLTDVPKALREDFIRTVIEKLGIAGTAAGIALQNSMTLYFSNIDAQRN